MLGVSAARLRKLVDITGSRLRSCSAQVESEAAFQSLVED